MLKKIDLHHVSLMKLAFTNLFINLHNQSIKRMRCTHRLFYRYDSTLSGRFKGLVLPSPFFSFFDQEFINPPINKRDTVKFNHREHRENYEIFYFATDSHRLFKINFFNIYLSTPTAVRQVCVSQWLN